MSFTYGGVNTDTLDGVSAALQSWPSLGGLRLETIDKEGPGGRFYAGASQSFTSFTHTVTIYNATPSEGKRDNFVGLLDPSLGPRDLILETDTEWKWEDVLLASGIDWAPMVWHPVKGFMWRAEVVFETVGEPYAVQITTAVHTFTASSSYTLSLGNRATFPTVEFPSGAAATVTIGAHTVTVDATPAGFTNVLNYQTMEFFRKNSSGVEVGSLVNFMSNFKRPTLQLGIPTALSVTGAPAGTRRLYPNARRV